MSFIDKLQYFFKSLFSPNDPEILKAQKIKNLEQNLSTKYPSLYKNRFAQSSIAFAFFELYKNVEFFREILDFIDTPEKILQKKRIYNILIYTGFDTHTRQSSKSLTFENRKASLERNLYSKTELSNQIKTFEEIEKELHSDVFVKIEETIKNLECFYDLCSYKYIDILSNFNSSVSLTDQSPHFLPQKCEHIQEELQSFYYVRANVIINASLSRLITAIVNSMPEKSAKINEEIILKKLKKIATYLNKVLSNELIKSLIIIGNNGEEKELQTSTSNSRIIEEFIERQKTMFNADTQRLELEHQNNLRLNEIEQLFETNQLETLIGYNDEMNNLLIQDTPFSFQYLQPLRVLKSFCTYFLYEEIQALLNDILVEGMFSIPIDKSNFSSVIYSSLEVKTKN